jgi:hypothetical protein
MDVAIAVLFVLLLLMCLTAGIVVSRFICCQFSNRLQNVDNVAFATVGIGSQLAPHHERWYIHRDQPAFAYEGSLLAALFGAASYIILFNQFIPLSLYVT